jgi:hypothetical protein
VLRDRRLEVRADTVNDRVERRRVADDVVVAHIDGEHGTVAEVADPPLVSLVQVGPVFRLGLAFRRTAARADAAE